MANNDLAEALEFVQAARTSYPEPRPWPEATYVFARMAQANLLSEAEREAALAELSDEVERLSAWSSTSVWASFMVTSYFRLTGRHDQLLKSFDPPYTQANKYAHGIRVAELFRRNDDNGALASIAEAPKNTQAAFRAFVQMNAERADQNAIAQGILANYQPLDGAEIDRIWLLWAMQLLAEPAQAAQRSKELAQELERMTKFKFFRQCHNVASYMAGECTAEKLVGACRESNMGLAHAHFAIAIHNLADNDRQVAQVHFRKVLETNYFSLGVHVWAEAFLKRMEDPNWLPRLRNLKDPVAVSATTGPSDPK